MDIKNIALSSQNQRLLREWDKKESKEKTNLQKEVDKDYTLELNSTENAANILALQLLNTNKDNSFNNFNTQIDVFSHILGLKKDDNNLTVYEKVQNNLENISEEAKEQISKDGYWGVEKTAERIFSFAKQSANNDIKKIEVLKSAINLGFEEAKKVWGGELPEISEQTHARIMEKFNQWEEGINNTKI